MHSPDRIGYRGTTHCLVARASAHPTLRAAPSCAARAVVHVVERDVRSRSSARVDFYFVPATDCASASLHWSLTLPILFRMQLRSLPGQLSFTSVVQALLISATRASLALHASENSAACVFTQSLMRPPPGLTSAHFALMSAAQTPIDRSFAIATGAERSTTAPTTIIFFIRHPIDICQRRRAVVTVNARYAFGPWRTWLKSKNPASPREREEEWRYFG